MDKIFSSVCDGEYCWNARMRGSGCIAEEKVTRKKKEGKGLSGKG